MIKSENILKKKQKKKLNWPISTLKVLRQDITSFDVKPLIELLASHITSPLSTQQ